MLGGEGLEGKLDYYYMMKEEHRPLLCINQMMEYERVNDDCIA